MEQEELSRIRERRVEVEGKFDKARRRLKDMKERYAKDQLF